MNDTARNALPGFVSEAQELLRVIDHAMLVLRRDPNDAEAAAALERSSRTLKSRAAALGMNGIVVEAQHLEWGSSDPHSLTNGAFATLNEARLELHRLVDVFGTDIDFLT